MCAERNARRKRKRRYEAASPWLRGLRVQTEVAGAWGGPKKEGSRGERRRDVGIEMAAACGGRYADA